MLKIILFLLVILFLFYIGNLFNLGNRFNCYSQNQNSFKIYENFQHFQDNNNLFLFDKDSKSRFNFLSLEPKVINYLQLKNTHKTEVKINCQMSFFNIKLFEFFNKQQNILKLKKINPEEQFNNQLSINQEDNILFNSYLKRKNSLKSYTPISNLWFIIGLNKLYFFFITNIPNISNISLIRKFSKIGALNNYDLIRLQRLNNILGIKLNIIKYKNKKEMFQDLEKNNIKFIFITSDKYDLEEFINKNPDFLLISIDKKYHSIISYVFKVIFFDEKKFTFKKKIISLSTCYSKEVLVINNINNYDRVYLFLILLVENLKKINYFTQSRFLDILNEENLSFCSPFFQYHPAARNFWINRGKVVIQ